MTAPLSCADVFVTALAAPVFADGALVPAVVNETTAEQTWLATPGPVTSLFAQARA